MQPNGEVVLLLNVSLIGVEGAGETPASNRFGGGTEVTRMLELTVKLQRVAGFLTQSIAFLFRPRYVADSDEPAHDRSASHPH